MWGLFRLFGNTKLPMFDLRKRTVPVIEEADVLQVDSEPHPNFSHGFSIRIQDGLQLWECLFFFDSFLLQLGKKSWWRPQPRSPIPCQDR